MIRESEVKRFPRQVDVEVDMEAVEVFVRFKMPPLIVVVELTSILFEISVEELAVREPLLIKFNEPLFQVILSASKYTIGLLPVLFPEFTKVTFELVIVISAA